MAKITHITRHNQLLSTKLEEFCHIELILVKSEAKLQIIEPLIEKTWGRGWIVLVIRTKMVDFSLVSPARNRQNILAKNIARTARSKLEGQNLLFGEYLRSWTTLYLLNLPINGTVEDEHKNNGGKNVLACFETRNYFEWIIKQNYWIRLSDLGGCYHYKTLLDIHNSSDDTQPHSIVIFNYTSMVLDFTVEVKNLSKFQYVSWNPFFHCCRLCLKTISLMEYTLPSKPY